MNLTASALNAGVGLLTPTAGYFLCIHAGRLLAFRGMLPGDWRYTLAFGACVWGSALTVIVELLSVTHSVGRLGLITSWLIFDLILLGLTLRLETAPSPSRQPRSRWKELAHSLDALPPLAGVFWLFCVLIASFLFGIAVTTPTTNWDSMSYHLPRVLHWIQQSSVAHFPTDNTRELEFGPWPAFVQLHLFLLTGSDRLANIPQWVAMVLTCLVTSYLTGRIGVYAGVLKEGDELSRDEATKRHLAEAFSAIFVATVPMGMMQAMTPQTDYIAAFWVICFCVGILEFRTRMLTLPGAAVVGMACGLGTLTKSTFYIYAAPFVIVYALWLWRQAKCLREKLKLGLATTVVFGVLNGSYLMRNQSLFGSPLGSKNVRAMVSNERISPSTFVSNLIRNAALHNNCGIGPVSRWLNRTALAIHSWTGEALDDPRTTYPPGPVKFLDTFIVYDDYASSPVHVVIAAIALVMVMVNGKAYGRFCLYPLLVGLSFALFLTLLKYQFWNSRFHLAYFILAGPLAALAFCRGKSAWFVPAFGAALTAYAGFVLRYNEARPIFHPHFVAIPREDQYLDIQGADWNPALDRITSQIAASGISNVGLKLGFDAFEYPIWLKLRMRGFQGRIDHAYVENESALLQDEAPPPDAIIARLSVPPASVTKMYPFITRAPPLMVLWKSAPPPRRR